MTRFVIAVGALLLGSSALALQTDSTVRGADGDKEVAIAKLSTAAAKEEYWEHEKARLAALETGPSTKTMTASAPVAAEPAVGGPYEEVATADLAPRPAAHNYPPCDPGPGDDNCIQLYEPGVRARLANWNRPTGGLADGAATAMGGPYEPIADGD